MCFHLFIAAFCCGNGLFLRAQEVRATMGGRVTDEQGAVVPNAAVTVVSEDTNVKQQTRTNNQGLWTAQFRVPGHYRFVLNASEF